MKRAWIPAKVGCHWFAADRQIAISTICYSPVDVFPQAAYGVWVDRELITEFPTLKAAQRFADDSFPVASARCDNPAHYTPGDDRPCFCSTP